MTSSRLTEKWINRGLWLIAFIFAGFLIGLGGLVVEDLPKVQNQTAMRDYVDKDAYDSISRIISTQEKEIEKLNVELNENETQLTQLKTAYYQSKETFETWLSTRQATQDMKQNPEVLTRTKALEKQQQQVQAQTNQVDAMNKAIEDRRQAMAPDIEKRAALEDTAYKAMYKVQRSNEVKVFLYRLGITLPLLLIGAWLFARKRKGQYWPFVWGFIFFALFAFFVELVPYLPSYGGYVRYIVGIIVTIFAGHYSIKALQNYLENQKKAEAMPGAELKEKLSYEIAQQRLSRSICPGCERPIDLKDPTRNFCIHCGTCVYNNCVTCNTRKNAFAKHCHSCGTTA